MNTIAQTSIDARLLYERIAALNVGDSISYKELSALIDRNVQEDGHGVLRTARRMAEREDRIVFDVVIGEGLRRLNDSEIVDTGDRAVSRIRRGARRAANTISAVSDFNTLPNEKKVKHNTMLSILGTIAAFVRPKTVLRIESAVSGNSGKLSVGDTLKAFGR